MDPRSAPFEAGAGWYMPGRCVGRCVGRYVDQWRLVAGSAQGRACGGAARHAATGCPSGCGRPYSARTAQQHHMQRPYTVSLYPRMAKGNVGGITCGRCGCRVIHSCAAAVSASARTAGSSASVEERKDTKPASSHRSADPRLDDPILQHATHQCPTHVQVRHSQHMAPPTNRSPMPSM